MTVKIRVWTTVLAAASPTVFGDPPDQLTPPVAHTNQGRTVEDEVPIIGMTPPFNPIVGGGRDRLVWEPPVILGGGAELLRMPDFEPIFIGDSNSGETSFAVTPAPSTLGLLALGGLALGRRRR